MRDYLRRLRAGITNSGPGYDTRPAPLPIRDDAVAAWLKAQRDLHEDRYGRTPAWYVADHILETYRLHADTGTPLDEHVCEGLMAGDCACFEQPVGGAL